MLHIDILGGIVQLNVSREFRVSDWERNRENCKAKNTLDMKIDIKYVDYYLTGINVVAIL